MESFLDQPQFASAEWGIHVIDAATGKPMYSINADRLFVPASNNKLLTTSAAFALVGGDYRLRTTVETTAGIDDHHVAGNAPLLVNNGGGFDGRAEPPEAPPPRGRRPRGEATRVRPRGTHARTT